LCKSNKPINDTMKSQIMSKCPPKSDCCLRILAIVPSKPSKIQDAIENMYPRVTWLLR